MDRGRVSPASEAVLPLALEQPQQDYSEVSEEWYSDKITNFLIKLQKNLMKLDHYYSSTTEVPKIKSTAANIEILEAMKRPQTGVEFLTPHPSLPSQTLVSADAVLWLNKHIEGGVSIDDAVKIMKVTMIVITNLGSD